MPSPVRRRRAAHLIAVAAVALLSTLVPAPASAAGLDSVTPNPAAPNSVLTVTANCNNTAAPSATVIYYHWRAGGFSAINSHSNVIPLGSDPDNKQFTDTYDTSGIESPGIEEDDYYRVLVICFIPEQESPEFDSGPIPIVSDAPPTEEPTPPSEPSTEAADPRPPVNPGVEFQTGVGESTSANGSLVSPLTLALTAATLAGAASVALWARRRQE